MEEDDSPTQSPETVMRKAGGPCVNVGRPEFKGLVDCAPNQYIYQKHRVVAVGVNLPLGKASQVCLRTRVHVVNKRPGHVVFVTAPNVL